MNEVYADVIAIPFHSKTSLLLIWCPSDIPHTLPRCHQTTLCRVSETLHQIHGRDVLTWIFYSLSACHLQSWRTHNDPHLQPTICHRASACGASPCTVSPVFLRGLEKRAHYSNTAVFCCCCKLPAVKTKKKALHLKRLQLFLQQVGLIDLPDLCPSHSPLPLRAESFDVCVCVPN